MLVLEVFVDAYGRRSSRVPRCGGVVAAVAAATSVAPWRRSARRVSVACKERDARPTACVSAAPPVGLIGSLAALLTVVANFPIVVESIHSESRTKGLPNPNGLGLTEFQRSANLLDGHERRHSEAATRVSIAVNDRSAATALGVRRGHKVVQASLDGSDIRLQAHAAQTALLGSAVKKRRNSSTLQKEAESVLQEQSKKDGASSQKLMSVMSKIQMTAPMAPTALPSAQSSALEPLASMISAPPLGPTNASISELLNSTPSADVADSNASTNFDEVTGDAGIEEDQGADVLFSESQATRHGDRPSPAEVARLGAADVSGALNTLRLDAMSGEGLRPEAIFSVLIAAAIICILAYIVYSQNQEIRDANARNASPRHEVPSLVVRRAEGPSGTQTPSRRGGATESVVSSEEPLSQISETTEHFAARLEEIIEQLSVMLKGTMRTYPSTGSAAHERDDRTWWYVGAKPGIGTEGMPSSRGFLKWSSGSLGWWPSIEAFHAGEQPAGMLPLGKISRVSNDDADPILVLVSAEEHADRIFEFRSWKEAKTWASTLAALIEQLHDEY
eukprot:TRINITY_DN17013_c0_g1_i1.p1 TRINITY_DN17013_c0_g1~~TRINITY_DN17013_c0_g1_i1.p1  ORF type:complete len:600 (+),score=97.78 TRINITY_DN17013_c0_g1_i1:115-1800(+)